MTKLGHCLSLCILVLVWYVDVSHIMHYIEQNKCSCVILLVLFAVVGHWMKRLRNTYKVPCAICRNKMPTRCNRGFYCRSYCLLNMFRAPLCPSSEAQEYYTVVAAHGIWCCGFQVVGLVWSWGLCVWFAGCSILQTRHITLSSTPDQQPENHSTNHCIILLSSWWWA